MNGVQVQVGTAGVPDTSGPVQAAWWIIDIWSSVSWCVAHAITGTVSEPSALPGAQRDHWTAAGFGQSPGTLLAQHIQRPNPGGLR